MNQTVSQKMPARLVVLLTDSMVNNRDLALAVYWIACREKLSVLYLVLVSDEENRLAATRDMVTMKAITSSYSLDVDAEIIETHGWLHSLQERVGPGDVVLCQAEQTIVSGLFKTISVSDFLASRLDSPVHTVSGYYHPSRDFAQKSLPEVIVLLGFLGIIAVFTWLQIRLDQALDGVSAKLTLMIMFCMELWVVWVWNKFTMR